MAQLDIESYLSRRFDIVSMNCWHLVHDAWFELTGEDLGWRTAGNMLRAAIKGKFDGSIARFEKLEAPQEPCIVLMRRPGAVPHVGIFYKRKILQMTTRGASYIPLDAATTGYRDVSFYR